MMEKVFQMRTLKDRINVINKSLPNFSNIAQLLLIRKFYCFRKGPHISFKYAQHNYLRCPMMGDVSLET